MVKHPKNIYFTSQLYVEVLFVMLVLDDTNFTTLITFFNDWINAIAFVTVIYI